MSHVVLTGEIEKDGLLRKLVSNLAPTNKGGKHVCIYVCMWMYVYLYVYTHYI